MIFENATGWLLRFAIVLTLVFLNGFFVAAEFALVKVRQTQLTPFIARGHRRARLVQRVIQHLDVSLSACQLGITLASLGLGWVGEPIFGQLLSPVMRWWHIESPQLQHTLAFGVGFSALTFLHIVVGEQAPKWLAIQKPLPTALWVAEPLEWFRRFSYPFIWLLNSAATGLLRRVGLEPGSESEKVHSEEELRLLLSAMPGRAAATTLGRNLVFNALDLRRRIAREVMRPRHEIVALDAEAGIGECLDVAERTRYSRFPLCEAGDLDRTLGVIHFKDLFAMRLKVERGADLLPAARKLLYVPETARLDRLLELFLDRKVHFGIVVDEYGTTVGMVTLENVLEELVGQIQDEFDQEKPLLRQIDERNWELAGNLPLHELSELVAQNLAEEGVTTTSGWITHQLGGFPKVGNVVPLDAYELRVEEMHGPRVARLRLVRRAEPAPSEG